IADRHQQQQHNRADISAGRCAQNQRDQQRCRNNSKQAQQIWDAARAHGDLLILTTLAVLYIQNRSTGRRPRWLQLDIVYATIGRRAAARRCSSVAEQLFRKQQVVGSTPTTGSSTRTGKKRDLSPSLFVLRTVSRTVSYKNALIPHPPLAAGA